MRRTSRVATLLGVLILGTGAEPISAQVNNPPVPPEPGISGPFSPSVLPYPGQGSPGGYGPQVSPYAGSPGGYPSQLGTPYPGGLNGYPVQPSVPYGGGTPAPAPGPIPTVALADQLVAQADTFLRAFIPKARIVPEGRQFIADAVALRNAAVRFRQAAATGAPPAALSASFQNVAACWQRLDSRMFRVSRGRIGPNIATALQMGRTIEQIRSLP